MSPAETLLLALLGEVDFVLRGGDCETCPECGLGPVGMLRDARKDAVDYLVGAGILTLRHGVFVERASSASDSRRSGGGK